MVNEAPYWLNYVNYFPTNPMTPIPGQPQNYQEKMSMHKNQEAMVRDELNSKANATAETKKVEEVSAEGEIKKVEETSEEGKEKGGHSKKDSSSQNAVEEAGEKGDAK